MWAASVQTSMRICSVLSGSSLPINGYCIPTDRDCPIVYFTVYVDIHFKFLYSENAGQIQWVSWGEGSVSRTPFNSKFHFHEKFWINLINLGHFSLYISPTSPFYYLWMCVKLLSEWQTVKTLIRRRSLRRLIWVYTISTDLSVRIRRVSTVIW